MSQDTRKMIPVRELVDGDHFRWRDAEWEIDTQPGRIIAFREGGFGSRVEFYDPVTAAKAGEFSWATLVEPL